MPRTITISSPAPGYLIASELQRAINLLHSINVEVLAAAQNVGRGDNDTATILLAYMDDRPRAIQILFHAGIAIRG
jgi:hypothetical protein